MSNIDKIKELENRIKELENELAGAVRVVQETSPLIVGILEDEIQNLSGKDLLQCARVLTAFADLKNEEQCHRAFKIAYENSKSLNPPSDMDAK